MTDDACKEVRIKIGLLFRKYRKQQHLSLRQLEVITGIDYSWIGKFEKGQANFQIDTLVKLASGLKIYLRDLTDFTHSFVDD